MKSIAHTAAISFKSKLHTPTVMFRAPRGKGLLNLVVAMKGLLHSVILCCYGYALHLHTCMLQPKVILEVLEDEADKKVKSAGQRLCQLIVKVNDEVCSSGILDVAVSFDGKWAKIGFTSLFGVFFVISLETGEVLDYHVLSKSCQKWYFL